MKIRQLAGVVLKTRVVVVGNGMVGQRFLEALVERASDNYSLTVLCAEPLPAYDRVHLSEFFGGRTASDLSLVTPEFLATRDLQLLVGEAALEIDRAAQWVRGSSGAKYAYDYLVMATGSYPFVPPLAGADSAGCHVYRTLADLSAIRADAQGRAIGVVVGGGLLGLEAAKALRDLGLQTHVVEFAPRLMAVQLDDAGARVLRARVEALGVTVHTARQTREIVTGTSSRLLMKFVDGAELAADLVVFSAGIRPQDALAKACGLAMGPRGGIAIDNACRTSDAKIFAIGECAAWEGRIFGLVAPGYEMAQVAAAQLCGDVSRSFGGADMSTKLKLLGVDVASLGDANASISGSCSYSFVDERRQIYKRLVTNAAGDRLLGAILVGDADDYGTLLQMMLNGLALPPEPERLILPATSGSRPAGLGVAALPDSAQICSCNNVTKGTLCAAVEAGHQSLGALKKATKAASSCGGCAPLVTQILKTEMSRLGFAVNNHLCEHFVYSRQQLFDLVRLNELRNFADVLRLHGRGLGCDVCKPAVASILASCWNEFVLSRDRAPLQDTNDYFLANIQKDGTYSVIPRIPGGEITPDKLIAIGRIAKNYCLYTKITGGQRIDLLGAQVHQLPLIWRELVAAGFESGHAYGKAMRTVKSCVGSSWCRYGVQDSVSMAIEIENRYRGLRGPHKIKLAVSGCTRECAEAQSKDVGVIATEKGWNLYVCGNGGMKPRHAELLAGDLDRDTLVRYIDRFLMYYIRTADRLQRTSVWLENLTGGLDYLRSVVCEDSLGIGGQLESDMARVIAAYECEWKKTIDDPVSLRRFTHFVNSSRSDPALRFVRERGQWRPAAANEAGVTERSEEPA